jgi:hypothetical protein
MRLVLRLAIDGCLLAKMALYAFALHASLMGICRANLSGVTAFQRYGAPEA